jgi:hypothetical protein
VIGATYINFDNEKLSTTRLKADCNLLDYVSQAMDHGISNLEFGLCRKWSQQGRGCKPRLHYPMLKIRIQEGFSN